MCAISGFINIKDGKLNKEKLEVMFCNAKLRGRDSFGLVAENEDKTYDFRIAKSYDEIKGLKDLDFLDLKSNFTIISNHRAEPTTEFIKNKTLKDAQPFTLEINNLKISIAHNGIIANDKELAKKYEIGEIETTIDTYVALKALLKKIEKSQDYRNESVLNMLAKAIIEDIKGSYAMAILFNGDLLLINNYKPLYLNLQPEGFYFASLEEIVSFEKDFSFKDNVKKLPAYSYTIIKSNDSDISPKVISFKAVPKNRALVVCSGGLDSTVSLKVAIDRFGTENVTLLHFKYNCNAEEKEIESVRKIVERLGVEVMYMPINIFGDVITESPILRKEGEIQTYDKGVEFAYEWVPARNLVMMSFAIALSEAKGFGYIYLGNNLEESGAYPDNEMEFINKLQDLMPNAVADGCNIKIEQPVGHLMKHEIVELGNKINAPMDITWSCYKAEEKHCGLCGPCRMRKVAFEMNNIPDTVDYKN